MRTVTYTRTTSCLIGEETPSDIIKIQNEHIRAYAKQNGYKIGKTYSDRKNDKSENAAFDQLLQDGMRREFDFIITDSLYRCGCHLWKAREVLMYTLFPAGIHFAVVEDNFCSIGKTMGEIDEFFQYKHGKYNEQNIKRKVMKRSRKGLLSWSDAKYGYDLGENSQLVVNEKAAPIVKRIFEMYVGGMDMNDIAATLETEKVPNPRVMRGANVEIKDPYHWSRGSVKAILGRTVYCGYWTKNVQGQEIRFTNEPLISEELYEVARKRLEADTRPYRPIKGKHKYNQLLIDKEYGYSLRLRTDRPGEESLCYDRAWKGANCDKKALPVEEVDRSVLAAIREAHRKAFVMKNIIEEQGTAYLDEWSAGIKVYLIEQAEHLAKSEKQKMDAYQKKQDGIISQEEFETIAEKAKAVVAEVDESFKLERGKLERRQKAVSQKNPWLELFLNWEVTEEITRELLVKYVEKIEIEQYCIRTVVLKEADWYMELPEEWRD
jgi:DNA invertase Pin-like site-specific DNA recombinase